MLIEREKNSIMINRKIFISYATLLSIYDKVTNTWYTSNIGCFTDTSKRHFNKLTFKSKLIEDETKFNELFKKINEVLK